jgi:hypothetical protein
LKPITLIGLSGGGVVSVLAANKLAEMGYTVNIITYNAPAAKAEYQEAIPSGKVNKFLEITTEGDKVAGFWADFGHHFDPSLPKSKSYQHIHLQNSIADGWVGSHKSAFADIQELIDLHIVPLSDCANPQKNNSIRSRPPGFAPEIEGYPGNNKN